MSNQENGHNWIETIFVVAVSFLQRSFQRSKCKLSMRATSVT